MPDIVKLEDKQTVSKEIPWDNFDDVLEVLQKMRTGEWDWKHISICKYINVRVDSRDMKCVISDRNNKRITLEDLKKQSK